MKPYFIELLISCVVLIAFNAYGQSNVKEAQFKDGEIALNKFIDKKFEQADKMSEWPSCIASAVFVKFNIDTAGNVTDLTFSQFGDIPSIFKDALTSAITATNGLWTPRQVDGKATTSRPFLLPFIYDLEAGCTVYGPDGKPIYRSLPNSCVSALRSILEFENNTVGNKNQLDCVLLQPLQVFSAN